MVRGSLIAALIIYVCISLSISTAHGQDAEFMDSSATIRGEVIEATPAQMPIEGVTVTIVNTGTNMTYTVTTDKNGAYEKTGLPPGRYRIAFEKEGYGNRTSRSKVVTIGSEISVPMKMNKEETLVTFFQKRVFTVQFVVGCLVGFAIGFLVGLILNSRPSRV